MRLLAVGLWFALALLYGGTTRADVVMPEPDDCPAGTVGRTCHGGPYCGPVMCTDGGECAAGLTCQQVPYCSGTINCAGMLPPDTDPSDFDTDQIFAPCVDGACANGTCQTFRVCAKPGTAPGEPTAPEAVDEDCAAGSMSGPWAALALALLALHARRRRRAAIRRP